MSSVVEIPKTPDLASLLPQLWNRERIAAAQRTLPPGIALPLCSINGDEDLPADEDVAVVVCYTYNQGQSQTAMLSPDLVAWGLTFVEALRAAMTNLKEKNKLVLVMAASLLCNLT